VVAGVLIVIIFGYYIVRYQRMLFLFDTLGIAMYTVVGVQKSLQFGVSPLAAIILGLFSAVMGGVIRDTLTNELPLIFRREIYATACLSGAALFVILHTFGVNPNINALSSISLIFMIRILSVKYKWRLPKIRHKI